MRLAGFADLRQLVSKFRNINIGQVAVANSLLDSRNIVAEHGREFLDQVGTVARLF